MKELEIGTYIIPADCRARVENGRVEVAKRTGSRSLSSTDYRCRDCKHRVKGHTTTNKWWESYVCDLKPKVIKSNREVGHRIYFCAPPYGKPCENFELRTKTESR